MGSNMTYRCPVCGWTYDPFERAERLGTINGVRVTVEEIIEQVPFHHDKYASVFCDGSAETPIIEAGQHAKN